MRALATAAALVFLGGCIHGSSAGDRDPLPTGTAAVVELKDIAFNPQVVTVRAGQVVGWHFDDGAIAHNVVGDGWRSPARTTGYYTHSFAAAGSYTVRCTVHTNMAGSVTVTP